MKRTLLASALVFMIGASGCQAQTPTPTPKTAEKTGVTSQRSTPNRLIHQKSPYLQQHADNVVDWYPWGDEAFQRAKAENKPIFLSIGYSTCHWCHVMEEESFMDPSIGAYLNEHFISIKVDRETRPDVDAIYMNFVQKTTGSGGWPLTAFITPDGVPIFGGTYFPNPPRFGRIGFMDVLKKITSAWQTDREGLIQDASAFAEKLAAESVKKGSDKIPSEESFSVALKQWERTFDAQWGGFQPAPKFPSPPDLDFLLRYGVSEQNEQASKMVLKTLKAIALGGIRDHLAGGFHRYSTDEKWLVPHFEKMLYDQAQLISLYSEAYAVTAQPLFKDAVESTIQYLEGRLRTQDGAYFSAEDADSPIPGNESEHSEGAFYVWTNSELKEQLTAEEFSLAVERFGVTVDGNASGDSSGELDGKNVLYLTDQGLSKSDRVLADKLRAIRAKRPRPNRDDKVLTEWNAMLACAYADAGRYLGNDKYLEQADGILRFLESKMVLDGKLKRSYLGDGAEIDAFAIDHAQLVNAYLALFQARGNASDLKRAVHWQSVQDKEFWDPSNGGYFDTRVSSDLLYRRKTQFDGATISTSSRSALNLSRLYQITGNKIYGDRLEALLKQVGPTLERAPTGLPGALSALLSWHGTHESIIVQSQSEDWLSKVPAQYRPHRTLTLIKSQQEHQQLKQLIPFLPPWSDKSKAYVCKDFSCGLPITVLKDVTGRS